MSIIYTHHAQDRMKLRSISEWAIRQTLEYPERTVSAKNPHTWKYIKTIDNRQYQIVATTLPDKKGQLVISVWVRGEDDPRSLVWQILEIPFKLGWWLLKTIVSLLRKALIRR